MSRLKQLRIIDSLITSFETIKKSQCSHSEKDVKILDDATNKLYELRGKKGKTNEQILTEVVKFIELWVMYLN